MAAARLECLHEPRLQSRTTARRSPHPKAVVTPHPEAVVTPHPGRPAPRRYGEKGQTVKEGGLGSYSKRIKELLDQAARDPEAFSRLAGVQAKVEQVRAPRAQGRGPPRLRGPRSRGRPSSRGPTLMWRSRSGGLKLAAGSERRQPFGGGGLPQWRASSGEAPRPPAKPRPSTPRPPPQVKSIMVDNVEAVLSRGEKLDLLVDKTDGLMNEVGEGAGAKG
jgi:hypothetical protein